ncbi:hypothetical protein KA005_35825, partial [bacterium]|nr:hypothetical protein [bacterium]
DVKKNPFMSLSFGIYEIPDILPVSQLTENIVSQTHITLFSVLSTREIHSSIAQVPITREVARIPVE